MNKKHQTDFKITYFKRTVEKKKKYLYESISLNRIPIINKGAKHKEKERRNSTYRKIVFKVE